MSVAGPSSQLPTPATFAGDISHMTINDQYCGGCKKTLNSEGGGVVVAFGASLWHTDCFCCAKCKTRVDPNTTLLLLGDGNPICSNCSYNCDVCKLPILDEAIMTDNDAYHASCFTCRTCDKRIEELVFAKTSAGIYCMECHGERVARSRRHAEHRRMKGSKKDRKESSKPHDTPHGTPRPADRSPGPGTRSPYDMSVGPSPLGTPEIQNSNGAVPFPARRTSSQYQIPRIGGASSPVPRVSDSSRAESRGSDTPPRRPSPSPRQDVSFSRMQDTHPPSLSPDDAYPQRERVDTLPLPRQPNEIGEKRRKSYDDGVRPLQSLYGAPVNAPSPVTTKLTTAGLDVPGRTSRADKRRSINPGLQFNANTMGSFSDSAPSNTEDRLSPRSRSPAPSMHEESPDSTTTSAYYSPSMSPMNDLPRSISPSRAPSPLVTSTLATQSVPLKLSNPASADAAIDRPPTSQSFPPRGQSLPTVRLTEQTSETDTSPWQTDHVESSPAPIEDASFYVESATSDEESHEDHIPINDGPPPPPPKDDPSPAFPETPSPSSEDGHDHSSSPSPRNTSSQEDAPALPPIRFSLHTTDFADLLKTVSDSPPKKPMPSIVTSAFNGTEIKRASASSVFSASELNTPTIVEHIELSPDSDNVASDVPPAIIPSAQSNGSLVAPDATEVSGGTRPHLNHSSSSASLSGAQPRPSLSRADSADLASRRLKEALGDATDRGATTIKLDREFVEAILKTLEGNREIHSGLKGDMDTMKRASMQYMTGFTVAQEEYHKEVAARRDTQAEVTRLRVQLSGQAARLTALSAEERARTTMERLAADLNQSIIALEQEVAKIRVDRDMSLAEIDELSALKRNPSSLNDISRVLSSRLDHVKSQYKKELEPLQEKRERLNKEIIELREARDIFLEETTALNSRNEELAELNSQIAHQIEQTIAESSLHNVHGADIGLVEASFKQSSLRGRPKPDSNVRYSPSLASIATSSAPSANTTLMDISEDSTKYVKIGKGDVMEHQPSSQKKFKWFGATALSGSKNAPPAEKLKGHNFMQASVMRFSRCDQCGDKMWGAQLRCTNCSFACHPRCGTVVKGHCQHSQHHTEDQVHDITPLPPSMFGRDLIEQVGADAQGGDRDTPVLVEKCISAVEAIGMDYEGIYRKTGGSSQSKAITQLFERGNYEAFDLRDTDAFNDISSVTSVLKNYFRALPNPLLTFELHHSFVQAASLKDQREKNATLTELVHQLPREHYSTLRLLMLHLNRIRVRSDENLMNARNLGVVFGPTLMRSKDPGQEFADMAGKALSIEWLVDNAPTVFQDQQQL